MKYLSRLRAILAFLFNRPLRVRLHLGEGHLYPTDLRVLPIVAGADGEEEEKEKEAEKEGKKAEEDKGKEAEAEEEEEETEAEKKEPDWKRESRKHERRAKKEKEAADELRKELKAREDADKTEQEKAVEKAREEGKTEALTEAQKERRSDRLESAVIRAAGKKFKIGEGEDAKEVRYDDPEDAETFLRHRISRGDIDEDELFDENGKVKTDVVNEYLKEILEEKPRLAEDSGSGKEEKKKTADGDADGGKGGESKAPDELSVEEHVKRLDKSKS